MIHILKNSLLFFLFVCLTVSCHKDDPKPSTRGSIVFWTPNLAAHGGFVDVTIDGLTRQITVNWATAPPNCLSTNGVAYFDLEQGTHDFSTVDYFGFTSTGSITIVANDCKKNRIE